MLLKVNVHKELLNKPSVREQELSLYKSRRGSWLLLPCALPKFFLSKIVIGYIRAIYIYIYDIHMIHMCICVCECMYILGCVCYKQTYHKVLVAQNIISCFRSNLCSTANLLNVYFASKFSFSAFITFLLFLTVWPHFLRDLFTSEFPSYSFIDCQEFCGFLLL